MLLKHIALLASAAAVAAACSDASPAGPVERSLYDLSGVKITHGTGAVPVHGRGVRGVQPTQPMQPASLCYVDGYCDPPREKPLADFDYGPDYFGYVDGSVKQVHIAGWSDNYANIDNMILTVHFLSVGGQGPQGCNATPAQFDQETVSGFGTPWGDHYSIWAERYATYEATATFVWGIDNEHTFDASAGYSVDGYSNVGTFYSSGRLCT